MDNLNDKTNPQYPDFTKPLPEAAEEIADEQVDDDPYYRSYNDNKAWMHIGSIILVICACIVLAWIKFGDDIGIAGATILGAIGGVGYYIYLKIKGIF